jgi:hypothetical protein
MNNPKDKVYTPDFIVDEVLDRFLPLVDVTETILEPFKGKGAFYNKLPKSKTEWCEIDEGVDFFDFDQKVDWIITNPPYSTFKQVLPKMLDVDKRGFGIKHIHYLGSGRQIWFPFGFPVGAVYLKKGSGPHTTITYSARCYNARQK